MVQQDGNDTESKPLPGVFSIAGTPRPDPVEENRAARQQQEWCVLRPHEHHQATGNADQPAPPQPARLRSPKPKKPGARSQFIRTSGRLRGTGPELYGGSF